MGSKWDMVVKFRFGCLGCCIELVIVGELIDLIGAIGFNQADMPRKICLVRFMNIFSTMKRKLL